MLMKTGVKYEYTDMFSENQLQPIGLQQLMLNVFLIKSNDKLSMEYDALDIFNCACSTTICVGNRFWNIFYNIFWEIYGSKTLVSQHDYPWSRGLLKHLL